MFSEQNRNEANLCIDAAKVDLHYAIALKEKIDSLNLDIRTFMPAEGLNQVTQNEGFSRIARRCDAILGVSPRSSYELGSPYTDINFFDPELDRENLSNFVASLLVKTSFEVKETVK